jgi:hypothetical protein
LIASPLELQLKLPDGKGPEERWTSASLSVMVEGGVVWPALGEPTFTVEVQIDDLLSHLTEFWKPLLLRQVYPIAVKPERPSLLRAEAAKRWADLPPEVAEREDELIANFEEAHDLSRCFAGLFDLPPLWLVRSGQRMVCETADRLWQLPFDAAHDGLVRVGDQIAAQLTASRNPRWTDLITAWQLRDQGEAVALLAWSAGLNRELARQLIEEGTLEAPISVSQAAEDDDELRIAARVAGALPDAQIRSVITLARSFGKTAAQRLDELSGAVCAHLAENFPEHPPFAQGEAIAGFLRERLGYASVRFIDVFAIAADLGIDVRGSRVEPPTLDGLAVWGPRHGPGAFINEASSRVIGHGELRRNSSARVTLAHELCHLIIDRGHALSAVDVLNNRMPPDVERRAKAFAGEFLLPGRVAADRWFGAGTPTGPRDLGDFLRRLRRRYGVTLSVAAWKLEHGLHRRDVDLRAMLDLVAPWR